jgi:outer membrane lipoprotein SlyB
MKKALVLLTAALLTACSAMPGGGYAPTVDTVSSPAAKEGRSYSDDLAQCQGLANQHSTIERSALTGVGAAALGAAGGAIVGALGPGTAGRNAALGAAIGGLGGATYGAVTGEQNNSDTVTNCMSARGWTVVGH